MDAERKAQLAQFVDCYSLPIKDFSILNVALTHKSYANENCKLTEPPPLASYNQRLEFLGDTVLGTIISSHLYSMLPDYDEGLLTRKKSEIVCKQTLIEVGTNIKLGSLILIGKGERLVADHNTYAYIADALEAVIGAVFLTCGFDICREFVLSLWASYVEVETIRSLNLDYKSRLQEYLLKSLNIIPEYKVIDIQGPDHKRKYTIALFIKSKKVSEATARTKKQAEQLAAQSYVGEYNIDLN